MWRKIPKAWSKRSLASFMREALSTKSFSFSKHHGSIPWVGWMEEGSRKSTASYWVFGEKFSGGKNVKLQGGVQYSMIHWILRVFLVLTELQICGAVFLGGTLQAHRNSIDIPNCISLDSKYHDIWHLQSSVNSTSPWSVSLVQQFLHRPSTVIAVYVQKGSLILRSKCSTKIHRPKKAPCKAPLPARHWSLLLPSSQLLKRNHLNRTWILSATDLLLGSAWLSSQMLLSWPHVTNPVKISKNEYAYREIEESSINLR